MGTARSIPLVLKFEIDRSDPESEAWENVGLLSVEPRDVFRPRKPLRLMDLGEALEAALEPGPGLGPNEEMRCFHCRMNREGGRERMADMSAPPPPLPPAPRLMCDACAVEDSVQNLGTSHFLESVTGVRLDDPFFDGQAGELTVRGRNFWHHYSGVDGEDWDEEFEAESFEWEPSGP